MQQQYKAMVIDIDIGHVIHTAHQSHHTLVSNKAIPKIQAHILLLRSR